MKSYLCLIVALAITVGTVALPASIRFVDDIDGSGDSDEPTLEPQLMQTGQCGTVYETIDSIEECTMAATILNLKPAEPIKSLNSMTAPPGCSFNTKKARLFFNTRGTPSFARTKQSVCKKVTGHPVHNDQSNEGVPIRLGKIGCSNGAVHILTASGCLAAASVLGLGVQEVREVGELTAPHGCSYNAKNGRLFFNPELGTTHGAKESICLEDPNARSEEESESEVQLPPILMDGSCGDGFNPINTSADCFHAATTLKLYVSKFNDVHSISPHGCSYNVNNGRLFFNPDADSAALVSAKQVICHPAPKVDTTTIVSPTTEPRREVHYMEDGDCQDGYFHIENMDNCVLAAINLGLQYTSEREVINTIAPHGCSFSENTGRLFYNYEGVAESETTKRSLCWTLVDLPTTPPPEPYMQMDGSICSDGYRRIRTPSVCAVAAASFGLDSTQLKVISTTRAPFGCSVSPNTGRLFFNTELSTDLNDKWSICEVEPAAPLPPPMFVAMDSLTCSFGYSRVGSAEECEEASLYTNLEQVDFREITNSAAPYGCTFSTNTWRLFFNDVNMNSVQLSNRAALCKANIYAMMSAGACEQGYIDIESPEQCMAAGIALQVDDLEVETIYSDSSPQGCFARNSERLFFNLGGSALPASSNKRSICRTNFD